MGARTESARDMAMESGRGLGGDVETSNGVWRMFSTLCDRECRCVGEGIGSSGFSGMGELWGTCCSGRSAFRTLVKALAGSVSSEPK
jgi:hypothetical protein